MSEEKKRTRMLAAIPVFPDGRLNATAEEQALDAGSLVAQRLVAAIEDYPEAKMFVDVFMEVTD